MTAVSVAHDVMVQVRTHLYDIKESSDGFLAPMQRRVGGGGGYQDWFGNKGGSTSPVSVMRFGRFDTPEGARQDVINNMFQLRTLADQHGLGAISDAIRGSIRELDQPGIEAQQMAMTNIAEWSSREYQSLKSAGIGASVQFRGNHHIEI